MKCETSKGLIEVDVHPEWSPLGAERFLKLVDEKFYNGIPLFRCVSGFLCQFGAKPGGQPETTFPDDPSKPGLRAFKPGYVSFAGYGANSRSTHIFVALAAAPSLGAQPWETPFAEVSETSMRDVVAHWNTKYGDSGPDPRKIETPEGMAYVRQQFPDLDWILSCSRH